MIQLIFQRKILSKISLFISIILFLLPAVITNCSSKSKKDSFRGEPLQNAVDIDADDILKKNESDTEKDAGTEVNDSADPLAPREQRDCSSLASQSTGLHRHSHHEIVFLLSQALEIPIDEIDKSLFYPEPKAAKGFTNNVNALNIDLNQVQGFMDMILDVLNKSPIISEAGCTNSWASCGPAIMAKLESGINFNFSDELKSAAEARFSLAIENSISVNEAAKDAIAMVLLSPEFIFKGINGTTSTDKSKIISRISYFLFGVPPNQEFSSRFSSVDFANLDQIKAALSQILVDDRISRFTNLFFAEWLGFENITNSTKSFVSSDKFPDFNQQIRDAMYNETSIFLLKKLTQNADAAAILAGSSTYMNAELSSYYGETGVTGNVFQEKIPENYNAAGILSQGAILVSISNGVETAPSKRGYWVQKNILCENPQPLPDDLMFDPITPDPNASFRKKLEIHANNPACAGCHLRMDNIGLSLESFDASGRFRTIDEFGNAIDPSGKIDGIGEFADHLGLAAGFSQSHAYRNCLTQKSMSYGVGRSLNKYDLCQAENIAIRNNDSNVKLIDLLAEVIASPSFRTD